MRAPNILDTVKAVIEVAPAHPEVAVWWYTRVLVAVGPPIVVVLEAREGGTPDVAEIGAELAERLGPAAVAVRMHRGRGETHVLYRLLTTDSGAVAAGHMGGG